MSGIRLAGVLIVAQVCMVVVSESAALGQAQTTTPPIGKFPGPCRAWLHPCDGSYWICTTEAAYWKFIFHVPGSGPDCPTVHPNPTPPPPPGECQLVNGTCKFTDSKLKCKSWVEQFSGNKCGSVTEYLTSDSAKSKRLSAPKGFGQYPPPNQLCLPINSTCQWYDPCISWKELFTDGNICGSLDEYYAFLYGQPPSLSGQLPQNIDPPGQCAIKEDHCDWYECTSWLDWCESYWLCGTVYNKETYMATPPPPCPAPPPGHKPPVQPGTCRFNITSGRCNFFPNTTECVSWIGWCGNWMCGTVQERAVSRMLPPPPCPLPPQPPVKPGTCKFNDSNGYCSFFPNKTACSGGKVYMSCGACPKTCANYSEPFKACSTSQCVTGCFCPSGTVEHNGQCINPLSCPMIHKTNSDPCKQPIYPPGYKPTCAMLEKQWTFNSTTGQCVAFAYSPCGEEREGYDVFATQEECIQTCMHKDPCSQSIYPPGFVPRCDVMEKQWTYNKTAGQCVEFYYHPCGEDREGYDVFASEQECIKTCVHIKDPCKQSIYPPGYIPSCDVVQKQWTYNKTNGKCVEFYYHPCGEDREGYDVFTTELECTKTCLHKDPCHQPIYPPGYKPTCRLLVNQWTYDAPSGQCVEFEYYPCGEDREGYDVFATKEECVNTCEH